MKQIILTLFLFVAVMTAGAAEDRPTTTITIADLDLLRFEVTLPEIIKQLERRIIHAKDLLRERKWKIREAYYSFQNSREIIGVLSIEASNLEKLYRLNVGLTKKGEVTDAQLFLSHNAWLAKKITILSKQNECRGFILEIARLAYLEITIDHGEENNGKEKETASASNR